jgi:lipopolysaccharide biosynthesis protein
MTLERFNFETVEPLCADFPKNPHSETVARRTCFAAKQAFQSENALRAYPDVRGVWCGVSDRRGYPLHLIYRHFRRLGVDIAAARLSGRRYGVFPPDVGALQRPVDLGAAPAGPAADALSVGVVLHVFYPHIFAKMLPYLRRVPRRAHLYVSTDTEEKAARIRAEAAPLGFGALEIRVLPNRGWDIAPFLAGFKDVLPRHDVLLKLHAKASTHLVPGSVRRWRDLVFSSLVGSERRVRRILSLFAHTPGLGMLIPPSREEICDTGTGLNRPFMRRLLGRHHIRLPADAAVEFPVGSMFWCRPAALEPWLELGLSFEDFAVPDTARRDGTLAHALERLFLFGCGIRGFFWGRLGPEGCERLAPPPVFTTDAR